MVSSQSERSLSEQFPEAATSWNLLELYKDLTAAKRQYTGIQKQQLTPLEQAYLRGILCGQSPPKIATRLQRDIRGLRVDLSRGLYRYIETLTLRHPQDWKEIPVILEAAGYKQKANVETVHPKLLHSIPPKRQDFGLAMDVSKFYGRTRELATLEQWIVEEECRLVAILGMGGIGKTALASKLVVMLQERFDYLIWLSLSHAPIITDTLADLLESLSDRNRIDLDDLRSIARFIKKIPIGENHSIEDYPIYLPVKNSRNLAARDPTIIADGIWQLIKCLQHHRCLIILDEWETVFSPERLTGIYREGYEDYGELLKQVGKSQHQSCLILTSTEKPKEIAALEGANLPIRSLKLGSLGDNAGEILRDKGIAQTKQYANLIDAFSGNPLALKIIATTIQDLFGGSISRFLSRGLFLGDFSDRISTQLARLTPLEKQILSQIATESQPIPPYQLRSKIPPCSDSEFIKVLESLVRRSLIEIDTQNSETLCTLPTIALHYFKINSGLDQFDSIDNQVQIER
ncbi:NB-ARC domain-containing protein [Microseira wollei]|uniref:WD-repeat protein n=1 Tax=Microseira wollei NIES-4236 TaxID=2530354 RepID=A0AAV3XQA4_9CYAN|nr:NB-ARC domain-containing protein [Microseira wollei]GET44150.1 WD-repeat protein [Microseira wollei NIES-4236]